MSLERRSSGFRALWTPGMMALAVAGVLLRVWYVIATPIGARSHDMGTHLDYVKYLVEHWALPPVHAGWEFHQAPLYYVLSAILWTANAAMGFADTNAIVLLRVGSLLLSVATLLIALRIGGMLLKSERERLTFGALLAAFPGLLYLAGEISNEALHHVLIFLEFLLLLRWWKSGARRDLVILSVVIGIGMLVKVSSLLIAAALGICILLRPSMSTAARWKSLGVSGLILTLLCGWFVGLRIAQRDEVQMLLLNNQKMQVVQNALVDNDPSYFLQFSPARIVGVPFNSVWDRENRVYFWEYLFRSAWFGEWSYDDVRTLSRMILLLGMLLLVAAFYGAWRDIREQPAHALPTAIVAFLLPLALLTYRIGFPCSWNQDFRFIPLFCVPMAYYAVRGIGALPARIRIAGYAVAWLMAALSAAFILRL